MSDQPPPPPPLHPGWQPADPAAFDQTIMDMNQALMNQAAMNQAPMDQATIGQVAMSQPAMNQVVMEQAAINQVPMDQVPMDQAVMNQPAMDQPAMDQPAINQAPVDQVAMNQAAMNQVTMGQVTMNQAAFQQAAFHQALNQASMNQPPLNQPAVQAAIPSAPTNPTVPQTRHPVLAVEETINAATFVHEHKEWLDKLLLPSPPMNELLPKIFLHLTHETIRVLPSEYNDKLYEMFCRMGDTERSEWCLQEAINQCVVSRNVPLPDNFQPARFRDIAERLWTVGHELNCAEVHQGREIERLSWELYGMMLVFFRDTSRKRKVTASRQVRNQPPIGNQGMGSNQPLNGNQGMGNNQPLNGNQGMGNNQPLNGNQGLGSNQPPGSAI
ncbi:hypothetical protein BGZ61DRAFT_93231 [Ilyonectria robusta]|uniref:uncharacterized protein n=1 Tax=Ilyonectria robusta TaxID=1079257 RepID=UPI001E8CC1B4|nr:uncharacterized protein BGZ61DRAFT_93231 [Ilyonectria robusta]KAH8736344.1 hypothetical protein BGZ61DRAFT_93231 [Ilyonectria robusta]